MVSYPCGDINKLKFSRNIWNAKQCLSVRRLCNLRPRVGGGLIFHLAPAIRCRALHQHIWLRSNSSGTFSPEEKILVQWVSFIGFYQKKIVKDFVQSASRHSLTGFLAHGKPAVACLEGQAEDIQEFLRHVRTTVFATVPRGSRKMTLGLREPGEVSRFETFEAKEFYSQGSHHRPDMLDRRQLESYLKEAGVPDEVRVIVVSGSQFQ